MLTAKPRARAAPSLAGQRAPPSAHLGNQLVLAATSSPFRFSDRKRSSSSTTTTTTTTSADEPSSSIVSNPLIPSKAHFDGVSLRRSCPRHPSRHAPGRVLMRGYSPSPGLLDRPREQQEKWKIGFDRMSGSVPNLACRKRLRSGDGSKRNIQTNDVEERGEKMQIVEGKVKNINTPPVFLEKEKERKRPNNDNFEKNTRTDYCKDGVKNKRNDNYKEGEKNTRTDNCKEGDKSKRTDSYSEGKKKISNEVNNGKASPASFDKEKRKEKLKISCSKKNMQTEDVMEEVVENWNDHSKLNSRKVSCKREKIRKRSNNSNCGKKIHGNGNEREETNMWNYDFKVKDEEVSAAFSENEKNKKRPTCTNREKKNLQSDVKGTQKQMRNLDSKMRNEESSATFFEKEHERKRPYSTNSQKKVQRDDKKYENNMQNGHYKVKDRRVSTTSFEKDKKRKMSSSDKVEKKMNGVDMGTPLSISKNKMQRNDGRKKTEPPITSAAKEKKRRPCGSTEKNAQHDSKEKKRNVPSDFKEGKMVVPIDSNNKKRKREEPHAVFKKEKRMQSDDNEKKIHSGNRNGKEKKNYGGGEKKKRNTPLSFFKVIFNNFKESLLIPPEVVPELEHLTNHHVYLEDSEGKVSKVRLSVVDGSLAFDQGWNNFASDHLIKWGEFLLFECSAESTSDYFSVRIFGRDSRERLHFDVRRKKEGARKKKIHTNTHGDLMSIEVKLEEAEGDCIFSGEYTRRKDLETHHVTVQTKEDPKRVECMVGSGPVPLDNMNGNEVIQRCKTQGMSPIRSKREIMIVDSESLNENNIARLTTSTADSDTHHMPGHTNEDLRRIHSGTGNGQSTVIDDEKGILPGVECGTKSTSPKCGIKRVASVDAAPLTHENDYMSKHDLKLHDSGEDLRWKQEISSIPLECTTAVNKYNNNGEMNISRDVCRKYEAPGGFRCLEKWKSRIVSFRSVLDDTELFKPESTRKTDSQPVLAVEYDAVGLNNGDKCFLSKDTHACSQPLLAMPVKDPSRAERVTKCEQDGTEINHSIDGKGTVVQLQTKKEQLETVGSILNGPGDNNLVCANLIVVCNSGPVELNPARSEGTFALIESQPTVLIKSPSSPDRICNFGTSGTEVNDNVDGKAKLEAKMGHLEPMDTVGSQSTFVPVFANNVAACQSDHCVFKQEDRNSIDFFTHVKTEILTPVKPEILEPDERSLLKINLQFCIPNSTQKWLELPKSLSNAVRLRRQDRNIIMLKDPMKRLWPVFYHENSIFVGFTSGWKHFAAANNLQTGDVCELFKEPGDEEPVYSVQITKK